MKQENAVIEVTDQSFAAHVLQATEPVLVDFWAPWCGPCRALGPTVENLATQYQGRAKVVKVNVDENTLSPARYDIKGIPTLVLFTNGQEVGRQVGLPTNPQKQLSELLDHQLHHD